jgi:transmembrane sensor
MADRGKEWNWIAARFAGQIDQESERLLNDWINASSYNARIYTEAIKIWQASRLKHLPEMPDPESEWERLVERMSYEKRGINWPSVFTPLRIAAALLIVLLSGALIYRYVFFETARQITVSAANEVKTFYLPDSTKVWLNVLSEISYGKDFNSSKRKINLKGQAYFTVKPDSLHPFTIQTSGTLIDVLGTSFDVNETDSLVQVIVEEGKVKLSKDDSKESIQLTRGEKGISTDQSLTSQKNTNALFAAWRKRNNPIYANETANPISFFQTNFTYKKISGIRLSLMDPLKILPPSPHTVI